MSYLSARQLLGLPVINDSSAASEAAVLGTVETVTVNPHSMRVDGFLVGRTGIMQRQAFLPRECVMQASDTNVRAYPRFAKKSTDSCRILGLPAWTTDPRALVGFVHDVTLSLDDGRIETITIHQLIRTWRVPIMAVERITPRALLIENDTTVKLKLTPYETIQ